MSLVHAAHTHGWEIRERKPSESPRGSLCCSEQLVKTRRVLPHRRKAISALNVLHLIQTTTHFRQLKALTSFMNPLTKQSWSPYLVGAGIGVLSWFAFATADRPIGITTAFEYTAALTEKAAAPQLAQSNPYFAEKAKDNKTPKIDWEWMLVVGVFLGAYLSSKLSGDRSQERVPPMWRWRFEDRPMVRYF